MCQNVADSTVDLLFETIAFFCDCNPFPDPLAPGRIRVRMPQRKDFRKKKKKKQVSGCKFQCLLVAQSILQPGQSSSK